MEPKYAGNILQFNNARDALGTAMYRAGIDVNTTDHADWQQALQALVDQRPLVKSYVMDEIYNMMESGEPPWPLLRRRLLHDVRRTGRQRGSAVLLPREHELLH
mgnify:CR=1 FL=1